MHELVGQFIHALGVPATWAGQTLALPPLLGSSRFLLAAAFSSFSLVMSWLFFLLHRTHPKKIYVGSYLFSWLLAIVGGASVLFLPFAWVYGLIGLLLLLILLPWLLTFSLERPLRRWGVSYYYLAGILVVLLPVSTYFTFNRYQQRLVSQNKQVMLNVATDIHATAQSTQDFADALNKNSQIQSLISQGKWGELSTVLQSSLIEGNVQMIAVTDSAGTVKTRAGQSTQQGDNLLIELPWLSDAYSGISTNDLALNVQGQPAFTAALPLLAPLRGMLVVQKSLDQTWLINEGKSKGIPLAFAQPGRFFVNTTLTSSEQSAAYAALENSQLQSDLNRTNQTTYALTGSPQSYDFVANSLSISGMDTPAALFTVFPVTSYRLLLLLPVIGSLGVGVLIPLLVALWRRTQYRKKGKAS